MTPRQVCRYCRRPRCLDSFAGEGGAGEGLWRAGFCVTPVDTSQERLARYPHHCPGAAPVRAKALDYLYQHGRNYALRWNSPPCTGYSQGTAALPDRLERYERLIGVTREVLLEVGGPYVIENVTSKVTRAELRSPLLLCWTMFNQPGAVKDTDGTPLWMRRHRLIESNLPLMAPGPCAHPPKARTSPGWVQCAGAYGGARRDKDEARYVRRGGYVPDAATMSRLLGIDWMSETGLRLSIPPAYTEHLGAQILDLLDATPTYAYTLGHEHNHPPGARDE